MTRRERVQRGAPLGEPDDATVEDSACGAPEEDAAEDADPDEEVPSARIGSGPGNT